MSKDQKQTDKAAEAAPAPEATQAAPAAPATEAQMAAVTKTTEQLLSKQKKRKVRLYQVSNGSADKPLEDVTVQINGHTYQIKRGEEVDVPESVYQVLEQAGRL